MDEQQKPKLSFIVTCKGRLHHLRQTLPILIAQEGTKTIVVDADCPDGTAAWVQANHPQVSVVKIDDMERFNISAARNAGIAVLDTPWVCVTDADVVIAADFWSRIQSKLQNSLFLTFSTTKETFGVAGTIVAESDLVRRCGGYDDVIQGYGGDDFDLYSRLARMGAKESKLGSGFIDKVIKNTSAERAQFYDEKDIRFSMTVNGLYRVLKDHVRNVNPDIDFDKPAREQIYAEARRAADLARAAHDGSVTFKIPLPRDNIIYPAYAELKQVLELELTLKDLGPIKP
jgi:glycosyltransferase involved in cell wall biosynthesis